MKNRLDETADCTCGGETEIRKAYLDGLEKGLGVARNIASWLQGQDEERAQRSIELQAAMLRQEEHTPAATK